jgi:hypothetical protein
VAKTAPIAYRETVTGETEVSDAQVGDNLIVKMTTSLLTTTHPLPHTPTFQKGYNICNAVM